MTNHQPTSTRNATPAFHPGDPVILTNGQPATVQFVSGRMNAVRVRTGNGRVRTVRLEDILPVSGHHALDDLRKPEILNTEEQADPVAGQEPEVSDRVTARAERSIAGQPRPVASGDTKKLGKKDSESGRPVMQPSNSIAENERLAAQAAPELDTRLSHLAARVPGDGPLKAIEDAPGSFVKMRADSKKASAAAKTKAKAAK